MTLYDPPALADALCNAITHSELEFLCDTLDNAADGCDSLVAVMRAINGDDEGESPYTDTANKLRELIDAIREREERDDGD